MTSNPFSAGLRMAVAVALAAASTIGDAATECQLHLSSSGLLTWTSSQTNVHAGLQYTMTLGDTWSPAPGNSWNFVITNYTNAWQLPAEAISGASMFLRMVVSTNDLGYGFPSYPVPQRTITVDGSFADWAGISPAITDPLGDGKGLPGSDITALYLARDANNIYFRLDLADGPPSPSLYYGIDFRRDSGVGDRFVFIQMSGPRCTVDQWDSSTNWTHFDVATGQIAVNQNRIEFSVPSNALNLPVICIIHAWDDISGPSIDSTPRVEAIWP